MEWFTNWLKRKARVNELEHQESLKQEETVRVQNDEEDPCNSYKKGRWQEESIKINFPLCVSTGFIPKADEFLRLHMSFSSYLTYTQEKIKSIGMTSIDSSLLQDTSIVCRMEYIEVSLKGNIYGNVVLSVFKPAHEMKIQNSQYNVRTAFTENRGIPVNMMLGVRCLECEKAKVPKHKVVITPGNPFIVRGDGSKVYAYRGEEDFVPDRPLNDKFIKLLDGKGPRYIYIPLTIMVDFEHIVVQTIKVMDWAYENAFPTDNATISIVMDEEQNES